MTSTSMTPAGGVAIADPPPADAGIGVQERRETDRSSCSLVARLSALGAESPIECSADNVSENGIFVRATPDTGLAVGQRFEVMLQQSDAEAENLAGDGFYATVVRTEVLPGDPRSLIGAGLCFDHPLYM